MVSFKKVPLSGAAPVAWNIHFILPVCLLALGIFGISLLVLHLVMPAAEGTSFHLRAFQSLLQTVLIEGSLALAILILMNRHHFGIWQLGMNKWSQNYVRTGFQAYLFITPALALLGLLLSLFRNTILPDQEIYYILSGLTSLPLALVFLFIIGFLAPFLEEIIFRGFLFGTMRSRFGPRRSMVYSSLLFAALHQSLIAFIPILFLAFILAYLYEKTGSLWPSIVLHIINNTVATVVAIVFRLGGVA